MTRMATRALPWLGLGLTAMLVGCWAGMHVQGWDAYTVVLSGTRVPEDPDGAIVKGALYGLSWMTMVVMAPVLGGGSTLWIAARRLWPGQRSPELTTGTAAAASRR